MTEENKGEEEEIQLSTVEIMVLSYLRRHINSEARTRHAASVAINLGLSRGSVTPLRNLRKCGLAEFTENNSWMITIAGNNWLRKHQGIGGNGGGLAL